MVIFIAKTSCEKLFENELKAIQLAEVYQSEYSVYSTGYGLSKVSKFMTNNRIKNRFLYPYISKALFLRLLPQKVSALEHLRRIYLHSSLTEEALSVMAGKLPRRDTYFYDVHKELDMPSLKEVNMINNKMRENNIFILKDDLRPTLLDIFIESAREVCEEEVLAETISIKAIKIRNEEFNLNVVATFIISASEYYSKGEIRNWINDKLLNKEVAFNDAKRRRKRDKK